MVLVCGQSATIISSVLSLIAYSEKDGSYHEETSGTYEAEIESLKNKIRGYKKSIEYWKTIQKLKRFYKIILDLF